MASEHRRILALALPVMLAQAATAATGVVDTAVMGLVGTKVELGAIATASVVFSFVYWAFGFLRMSTTGLVAQALGARHPDKANLVVGRATALALVLGGALLVLAPLLRPYVFSPFGVTQAVENSARTYFLARIWGAPALLASFACTGLLLGAGRTRALVLLQVIANGVNGILDVSFVVGLDWGPAGIGAGTAISEWVAFAVGTFLIRKELIGAWSLRKDLWSKAEMRLLFAANIDISIRTVALLFSFAWFVRSGASFGTAYVAGNEVLLQFISVAAFVLDGFAFVAEKEVGEAFGAREAGRLREVMKVTTQLAVAFALLLSLGYYGVGPLIVRSIVDDAQAQAIALRFMPFCALVPLLGVPAWQFDGFFLGATQGRALRNAAVLATASYVLLDLVLRERLGPEGVWWAFAAMYLLRALFLGAYIPALLRGARSSPGHT